MIMGWDRNGVERYYWDWEGTVRCMVLWNDRLILGNYKMNSKCGEKEKRGMLFDETKYLNKSVL